MQSSALLGFLRVIEREALNCVRSRPNVAMLLLF